MERKIDTLIIGGGISGLSLGYYLKKLGKEVCIIEKEPLPGGVIGAVECQEITFLKGPKTFKSASADDLIDLIHKLGIQHKIVYSKKESKRRFIYDRGALYSIRFSIKELLFNPLMRAFMKALLKEPFIKKGSALDESIESFSLRRFGKEVTYTLIEPLVKGICGGAINELSLLGSFPQWKEWEQTYGSLIKGMWYSKKKKKNQGLFSLQGGIYSLIEHLSSSLKDQLLCSEPVVDVKKIERGYLVYTPSRCFLAKHVYSTLQPSLMEKWTLFTSFATYPFFQKIRYGSIVAVSLAFSEKVNPKQGFGYLTTARSKESIMGVMFDSQIFDDPSLGCEQMTVMLDSSFLDFSDTDLVKVCYHSLYNHLGITAKASGYKVFKYPQSLAFYPVNHHEYIKDFQRDFAANHPMFYLAGHYMHPPGVNECVKFSKLLSSSRD